MMRRLVIAGTLVALAVAAAVLLTSRSGDEKQPAKEFAPIAKLEIDGNAEIVQATPDGQLLVHTNTDKSAIDIVDISSSRKPKHIGRVVVPGEPTSVAVSPDGKWALATLYIAPPKPGKKPTSPYLPGGLAIISLTDPTTPTIRDIIGIGHHPDSIALASSGADLVAVIAVENEPEILRNNKVQDNKEPGNPNDISTSGQVQVVTFSPERPGNYRIAALDLSASRLTEAGLFFPDDAQPEFVTLSPDLGLAAASLQENNGIVIFDPYWLQTHRMFSTGRVKNRKADLKNDKKVALKQLYPADVADQEYAGSRFPDGIAFTPNGKYIVSADEGEMPFTGGRGFSIWSLDGELIWDDGGKLEKAAAKLDLYPDKRSEKKGIEVEGVATARMGMTDFAFLLAERGSFMAVYDISTPSNPELLQILTTGKGPEGITTIPTRNIIAVAAEKGGVISLYKWSGSSSR